MSKAWSEMPPETEGRVICRMDELLVERGMTLTALSQAVGITIVNLSILKNNRAKAIKFSTLTAICDALECSVGELLVVQPSNTHMAR